jgi:hypothetical protein
VGVVARALALDLERADQPAHVGEGEAVRLGRRGRVVHVDAQDQHAPWTEDPPDLVHRARRALHVVEAVAGHDDVDRVRQERDRLRADREVERVAVQQEPSLAEAIGERIDADGDPGGTGVGESERAGTDVHDHAVAEQVVGIGARLGGHPPHLGACDLPAPALVGLGHVLTRDERGHVAGVEPARAHDAVPLVEPPAELGVEVGLRASAARPARDRPQ